MKMMSKAMPACPELEPVQKRKGSAHMLLVLRNWLRLTCLSMDCLHLLRSRQMFVTYYQMFDGRALL
jgi:hypothetical protein